MVLNWELREVLPEFRPEGRLNVLLALMLHANVRLRCWPSVDRLADETGFFLEAVTAAKKWLLERGAIVLVPFGLRMGQERQLPARQHVYQLTGVIQNAAGQWVPYLYLTPEAEADLRKLLEDCNGSTGEVLPSETLPVEGEVGSTTQDGSTSQDKAAAGAAADGGEDAESQREACLAEEAEDQRLDEAYDAPGPEEPKRVDAGDEFGEEYARPKWAIPDTSDRLLMQAFNATGRKWFQKGEKVLWKQVHQAMVARSMSTNWVKHCIEYAEEKQVMTFSSLVKWMLNSSKRVDWERKQAGKVKRVNHGVSMGPED